MKAFLSKLFDMMLNVLAHLFEGLRAAAAGIVGKVLSAFGLTMVSFSAVLPPLKAFLAQQVAGLPPQIMQMVGALGIDVAMTMVVSALTVRLAWKVLIIPKSVASQIGV